MKIFNASKLKNKLVEFFLGLIAFLLCQSGWATESAPPRLWKATSPPNENGISTNIYLLAVTHLGLPSEYDHYFYKKVVPIFRESSTFGFEGAGNGTREPRPPCNSEILDNAGKIALRAARVKTTHIVVKAGELIATQAEKKGVKMASTFLQRANGWQIYFSQADEYDLISQALLFKQVLADDEPPKLITHSSLRPSVVDELMRLKPGMPIEDVDSQYGIRRAYCSSGPARIDFLVSQLNSGDTNSPAMVRNIPRYMSEFSRTLREEVVEPNHNDAISRLDQTFICNRNTEWVLEMSKINDNLVHFYALGVNHFFYINHDGIKCNGLLADLEQRGYEIKIIK